MSRGDESPTESNVWLDIAPRSDSEQSYVHEPIVSRYRRRSERLTKAAGEYLPQAEPGPEVHTILLHPQRRPPESVGAIGPVLGANMHPFTHGL